METSVKSLDKTVLVFGATGQQGGSVASALRSNGWRVKALVRDPNTDKSEAIAAQGIELVRGDLTDVPSIQAAMVGIYGVFSVQPSSGQGAAAGVTDEAEIRYGKAIADIAVANDVHHLVYSSANAAGATKTGIGHFDTKSEIEEYIRGLNILSTVIRPSAFMEILTLPGMGLDKGAFAFFMRPDQPMQFIAVEDIGKIVARIFAAPAKLGSQTIEIAGDTVTGAELAEKFSRTAGCPITYHRFPDSLLEQNAFLGRLARLVDQGRLAGNADVASLRENFPGLLTMDEWLTGAGRSALLATIQADGGEVALR
ncbi:NmrA/HSCARG family protein [Chlorogloea sp. CCALA 695]|uniref:NmrA/HSCARG family protein n=1 Tax=Chlorogloea sp. CCALA 695 TaxID=2107693 RepID=UPI000D076C08|nr:NmrA/HSCARG family protein [Chlorogloea sp. CCALA 695]PSB26468.1 NmrA family protein [Chlorogloea sp. CCALA 695]